MALDVLMPVITAEGEEAVITAWFVDEGQACSEGDLVAEVQAEKVSDEVHAPGNGFVVNRVAIGDPVPQGSPLCQIVDTVERPADVETAAPPADVARPAVLASPAAKRVARELGVDLSTITGTGPEGRITEADVQGAARPGPAEASPLREVIARHMRRSHAETVPVTLFTTVDLGQEMPSHVTARVVKAVAQVLPGHQALNGHRVEDRFVPAPVAHVAIAIQTSEGLVAPVVRDPADKSVEQIADAIRSLADRAEAKTLTAADYADGSFSVSNLGRYGVDGFTPIINHPQMAILGVGAIRPTPVVGDDGGVVMGQVVTLSLTFDHAFVDGAPAAEFLQEVAESLA